MSDCLQIEKCRASGGVGELQVTVQGPHNKLPISKEEINKPQNFLVGSYAPEEVGAHKITVNWGKEEIPESSEDLLEALLTLIM